MKFNAFDGDDGEICYQIKDSDDDYAGEISTSMDMVQYGYILRPDPGWEFDYKELLEITNFIFNLNHGIPNEE